MKTLILTEKPSVARDFAKALDVNGKRDGYMENDAYIITWAIGHLVELFEPEDYDAKWKKWHLDTLPIVPEQFSYKSIPKTASQLRTIQKLLAETPLGTIVIATDAGREGEVIARTILLFAGFEDNEKVKRFWTSQALTPQVVREGMKTLRAGSEYDRLWRAGQSRQIADWLVGMNGSRAATLQMNDLFTVGRVQTAVLSLLVDRRRERENFKPEPYWILRACFANEKGTWWGIWFRKKLTRFSIEDEAKQIQEKITDQTGEILSAKKQKKKQPPPLLYSLTDLQQEANKKFGCSAEQTLNIAQKLYEERKCLSYPRTDSKVLGSKNVGMIKSLVKKLSQAYGKYFAGVEEKRITVSNTRVFNDAKLTDHHALIPFGPIPNNAGPDEMKIYGLVLKRFAAAFHLDCEYEQTEIITQVQEETFRTKGKQILRPGWQVVYETDPQKPSQGDESEPEYLPPVGKGDPANVRDTKIEKKKTTPPPEYTEALLLKDMTNPGRYVSEDELKKIYRGDVGLGTQATRAQMIETLLARHYADRQKKHLIATDKGCCLIETLRHFNVAKILASPQETARWEMQLNQIAQGKGSDQEFLDGIRSLVERTITEFKTAPRAAFQIPHASYGHCPLCGGNIIKGKRDYGCSNWRKQDGGCRFVIPSNISGRMISPAILRTLLVKNKVGPLNGFVSADGKPFPGTLKLVEKNGKWEVDLSEASQPPKKLSKKSLGECPACGGEIIQNEKAYGCSKWKREDGACKFVVWKIMAQREISEKRVVQLLENGVTDILFGFMSKKGNAFSAKLKLDTDNLGVPKVVFDFSGDRATGSQGGIS